MLRVAFAAFFAAGQKEFGDQAGPAGLMRGTQAAAVIAVKVLEEEDIVAKVGSRCELLVVAQDRPPSVRVAQEDSGQAASQLLARLL